MDDSAAADTFARLAHQLHDQDGFEETLELLVEASPALVGSDSAAVLLFRKGRLAERGPGSDTAAEKADQLQLEYEAGPAWEAACDRRTVHVPDTQEAETVWGEALALLGIRSAISVRMWTANSTLGAISFYAHRPRAFDANSVAVAEIIGRHASIALASARSEESLHQAIDGRKLVGQAQGILMERFELDDRQAFDVLRRYSQSTNTKLIEVARLLVSTRKLPEH
ncbi:MAG TPA: GAF and ANTAR domain-containing protein [Nocardioides sp.]|nr:GAF and ANTAR domain-containing protein [Nocardioides sp.]